MNALSLKSACLCFLWSFLFASVVSTEPTGSCVHPVFRDLVQLKRKVLAIGLVHGELALFASGTADTDQLDGGLQINVLAANLNAFDVDLNPVPIPSGVPSGPVKFACQDSSGTNLVIMSDSSVQFFTTVFIFFYFFITFLITAHFFRLFSSNSFSLSNISVRYFCFPIFH